MNSRDIEHAKSQGKGLAGDSSVAKRSSATCPTHSGMEDRTNDTVGAAPTGVRRTRLTRHSIRPSKRARASTFPRHPGTRRMATVGASMIPPRIRSWHRQPNRRTTLRRI